MGNVVFAWSPDSNFIAAAGENKIVYILDRLASPFSSF